MTDSWTDPATGTPTDAWPDVPTKAWPDAPTYAPTNAWPDAPTDPPTASPSPSPDASPSPTWSGSRRLPEGVVAVLAPLTACLTALVGLTAWTTAGGAGTPARIEVGIGQVFMPYADKQRTAAFFRITNTGGSGDQLLSVTSPAAEGAMLSRHESAGGADSMRMVTSAEIPAGSVVRMTPSTLDVMMTVKGRWQVGDAVPFVLHFRHSGPVQTVAFVVRPGSGKESHSSQG
ncbi:copper chaperone PCu(A)C [Streptomyces sp. NPDC020858]|uniref:copper chaperone PCu(A)C n=1 Tax=Streptomyces sp. NPDC020858 TaxID=3365097 RepID=UPI003790B8DF